APAQTERTSQMKDKVRVALLGCGTVGGGVIRLLSDNKEHLAARVGAELEIKHVLVRDPARARVPECDPRWVTTDAAKVMNDPDVDLVAEVIGGEQPALSFLQQAI